MNVVGLEFLDDLNEQIVRTGACITGDRIMLWLR